MVAVVVEMETDPLLPILRIAFLQFLDPPTPARCTCRTRRVSHHPSPTNTDDLRLRSPRFASRSRASNGDWT